jgi:hypothetical protein
MGNSSANRYLCVLRLFVASEKRSILKEKASKSPSKPKSSPLKKSNSRLKRLNFRDRVQPPRLCNNKMLLNNSKNSVVDLIDSDDNDDAPLALHKSPSQKANMDVRSDNDDSSSVGQLSPRRHKRKSSNIDVESDSVDDYHPPGESPRQRLKLKNSSGHSSRKIPSESPVRRSVVVG